MSDELYFNNELRKCLNAAGLSDCGENDQWNYWYQRLHKAHDAAVDRVTETQRAENAKLHAELTDLRLGSCPSCGIKVENECLRELVRELYHEFDAATQYEAGGSRGIVSEFADAMRELGIEVDA